MALEKQLEFPFMYEMRKEERKLTTLLWITAVSNVTVATVLAYAICTSETAKDFVQYVLEYSPK